MNALYFIISPGYGLKARPALKISSWKLEVSRGQVSQQGITKDNMPPERKGNHFNYCLKKFYYEE